MPLHLTSIFKKIFPIALLSVFLAIGSGCEQSPENHSADGASVVDAVQTYQGIGVVKTITPSKTYVNIDHDAIPGFMDAMSMFFATDDTLLFDNIQVEDSIRFTIEVKGGEVRLTDAEVINP